MLIVVRSHLRAQGLSLALAVSAVFLVALCAWLRLAAPRGAAALAIFGPVFAAVVSVALLRWPLGELTVSVVRPLARWSLAASTSLVSALLLLLAGVLERAGQATLVPLVARNVVSVYALAVLGACLLGALRAWVVPVFTVVTLLLVSQATGRTGWWTWFRPEVDSTAAWLTTLVWVALAVGAYVVRGPRDDSYAEMDR